MIYFRPITFFFLCGEWHEGRNGKALVLSSDELRSRDPLDRQSRR